MGDVKRSSDVRKGSCYDAKLAFYRCHGQLDVGVVRLEHPRRVERVKTGVRIAIADKLTLLVAPNASVLVQFNRPGIPSGIGKPEPFLELRVHAKLVRA